MKRVYPILILLFFTGWQIVYAQKTISGTVIDEHEMPVAGANVSVVGYPNEGTITDLNGMYTVTVPDDATSLLFSYIGMKPREELIGNSKFIDIQLESDDIGLEEIVVVAYGTTKKSSFTGSVNVLKSKEFENINETSFEKTLQGNAPGVLVTNVSGQAGSQATVRIRGTGSINANSSPLYVIDGVPVESGNISDVADPTNYGTSATVLSTINPADIESVSVLKDASASSLYGARAANGVIIITTKQGEAGKTKFTVGASAGISDLAMSTHKTLNASQYFKTYWDYYYNEAINAGASGTDAASTANASTIAILEANPYNNDEPYGANGVLNGNSELMYDTNWKDIVYKLGKSQDYNMSAAGGNEKTTFFFSGGYKKVDGNEIFNDFERFSAKLNLKNEVSNFFEFNFNNTFAYTDQNTPPGSGGAANPVKFANEVASVYSNYQRDAGGNIVYDASGNPLYDYNNPVIFDFNPIGIGEKDIYNIETGRLLSSFGAKLKFLKDFSAQTNLGIDYIGMNETRYYNPMHGNGASVNGRSTKYAKKDITWTITNRLDWKKTIADAHTFAVLLGQEASNSRYDHIEAEGVNFAINGNDNLRASATPNSTDSYFTEKRFTSYFSRLNYDFANKYYLDLSFRRDGSSVFGPKSKWGNFWSVGGTWRISEESFLYEQRWLTDLKIRASYGTSGNDRIGRYAWQGQYGYGYNYEGQAGMSYSQMENSLLHWEESEILDIGLEIKLFDKITIEADYYNRISKDLLFYAPLSMTTGFSSVMSNLASVSNSGVELLLNSKNIAEGDFKWSTDFNFTLNKNEIISMNQNEVISGTKRWMIGGDLYQFYIQEYAGVDPADGQPMWWMDITDGQGNSTGQRVTTKDYAQASRYEMGSSLPLFYGGITNTLEYQGISLSFSFYYSYGGKVYDNTLATLSHSGATPGTQLSDNTLNAWTPTNTNTQEPVFEPNNSNNANATSSRFLFDGSYARLKNVTLTYFFPKEWLSGIKLSSAKVYLQGENLYTFTRLKGQDPEMALSGLDDNDVPNVRTITFGFNFSF